MKKENNLENKIEEIKEWNGFCECCGKSENEGDFKIWKKGDKAIKELCLDCKNKQQCEICFKWTEKIAYLQVSIPGLFKYINFCSAECKKEARKQTKVWIKNYYESNGIKKECKKCGNTRRDLDNYLECSDWRACVNEENEKCNK